jgi:hypothetical protein
MLIEESYSRGMANRLSKIKRDRDFLWIRVWMNLIMAFKPQTANEMPIVF